MPAPSNESPSPCHSTTGLFGGDEVGRAATARAKAASERMRRDMLVEEYAESSAALVSRTLGVITARKSSCDRRRLVGLESGRDDEVSLQLQLILHDMAAAAGARASGSRFQSFMNSPAGQSHQALSLSSSSL